VDTVPNKIFISGFSRREKHGEMSFLPLPLYSSPLPFSPPVLSPICASPVLLPVDGGLVPATAAGHKILPSINDNDRLRTFVPSDGPTLRARGDQEKKVHIYNQAGPHLSFYGTACGSACGHWLGVGCMRRGAAHGSACGHSFSGWERVQPLALLRVHAAHGGRACALTTERRTSAGSL
jgi:hypothetical protein